MLPKIHKRLSNVPGRPVISNCGAATEKVSAFLDLHLKPIMQAGKSYLRDTDDFLTKIKQLGPIPEGAILVTADVAGLYPNIPHEDGLNALKETLQKRNDLKVPAQVLVDMAEFVLKNNYFEFDSAIYHQISGTAIGTKFAPPYACIFMDFFEEQFLKTCTKQPWAYFRYIDDIFMIWTEGEQELLKFLDNLNSFNPSIKFEWDFTSDTRKSVEFLDVTLSVCGRSIVYDLYCKPTDCHQFLHYQSCHADHIKNSIVYSSALRIKKRCSDQHKFEHHLSELEVWFKDRGYPKNLIQSQISRSRQVTNRLVDDIIPEEKSKTGTPLVITYHPAFKNLNQIMRKHVPTLQRNPLYKDLFDPLPFVCYRKCKSVANFVVRSKLPPLVSKKGVSKCGDKRCKTCPNIKETCDFTSNKTGKTYKINFDLNCASQSVIYLVSCKVCGIQYVGETTRKMRDRWTGYRQNYEEATNGRYHTQQDFHAHFMRGDHSGLLKDAELILIDKTNSFSPKIREKFWIKKLETLHPNGLNISENT